MMIAAPGRGAYIRVMPMILYVAAGGAIGASMRYLTGLWATRLFGHGFPHGTLACNVIGSLLMGMVIVWLALKVSGWPEARAFLTVGVLGGFTTFSAFSLDVVSLYERKALGLAVLYITGSVALSIMAVFAGMWLMRKVL